MVDGKTWSVTSFNICPAVFIAPKQVVIGQELVATDSRTTSDRSIMGASQSQIEGVL